MTGSARSRSCSKLSKLSNQGGKGGGMWVATAAGPQPNFSMLNELLHLFLSPPSASSSPSLYSPTTTASFTRLSLHLPPPAPLSSPVALRVASLLPRASPSLSTAPSAKLLRTWQVRTKLLFRPASLRQLLIYHPQSSRLQVYLHFGTHRFLSSPEEYSNTLFLLSALGSPRLFNRDKR